MNGLERERLRELFGRGEHPQLVLRMGYANEAPATPRRGFYSVVQRPE